MIEGADLRHILQLKRPLACIDVETHDKCQPEKSYIIEMGLIVFYPGDKPTRMWQSLFRLPSGVKIHPAATQVHKITPEMLEEPHPEDPTRPRWPYFEQQASNLARGLAEADFFGYNVDFDLRCFATAMKRAGVPWSDEGKLRLDPMHLWRKLCPRTNSDFVREYGGREPGDAHRALTDIQNTVDGFMGFFQRHQLPATIEECTSLCKDPEQIDSGRKFVWKGNEPVINFGKWNGTSLFEARGNPSFRSYLGWMLNGEFASDTKQIAQDALNGQFPERSLLDTNAADSTAS